MHISPSLSAPPPAGEIRAEYRQGAVGFIVLFALIAGFFGFAAWMSATATPPNPLGALFGGLGSAAFIGAGAWAIARMPWRIRLYDEGMFVERPLNPGWFAWDTLTFARSTAFSNHGMLMLGLEIRTADGRKLAFTNSAERPRQPRDAPAPRIGIGQLTQIVFEASAPARYQALAARYDAGQPIDFRALTVSQAGITHGRETLSWPMVADIQADDQRMIVFAQGQAQPWRTITTSQAPNADLLPALVAHAGGGHFSAFREGADTAALEAASRTGKRRQRLVGCILVPLLVIGLNLGVNYAIYFFSAGRHYNDGRAALERGDSLAALESFDRAVAMGPGEASYYAARGLAYARLGRYDEALADYDAALGLRPGYAWALCGRGDVHHLRGELERARADYTDCRDNAIDGR